MSDRRQHRPRGKPKIKKVGRGQGSGKCAEPPSPAFIHGLIEFNEGRYFEQHETLEALWVAETDPVRYLYQGILQIGVGLFHRSRGNHRGALTLLARGILALEPFRPACHDVDVDHLLGQALRYQESLLALAEERITEAGLEQPPRVRLLPGSPGANEVAAAVPHEREIR